MAAESTNDEYSVKNLLFYRAIPNYVAPENTAGYNLYSCKDCGDRFVLETSYQYHIERKSVLITYKCRYCVRRLVFHNRCNLLSHIRSHTFKTATINVSDLKIDPLPLNFYKLLKKDIVSNTVSTEPQQKKAVNFCFECKKDITVMGPIKCYKDRAYHYMEYTNKVYSCPVCLFTLPTICGLKAHLRIHLKMPPFYCPECGIHMSNKSAIVYPYSHACEGFNMMRATTRYPCPIQNCTVFHPNDFKHHMKEKHLKIIFSCPACVVACFNEATMQKHLKTHDKQYEALIFYQCEMCPGRLVMQSHVENHIGNHKSVEPNQVYPCWICNTTFKSTVDLINHHIQNHDKKEELKNCISTIKSSGRKIYRVVKQCDQCLRNFTYKCHYEDISILPNACPYKCSPKSILKTNDFKNLKKINCPLCKEKISQHWLNVKQHFALHHKDHRCLDAKISFPRICVKKYLKQYRKNKRLVKANTTKRAKETKSVTRSNENAIQQIINPTLTNEILSPHVCRKCQEEYETKESLEAHLMKNHRDPCMAYQCMECGDCFIVKPSFSIHLLFHGITDVDEYISRKKCYNENALNKCVNEVVEEPLDENQCKICRDRFDDTDELKKHFRVHGMAFLMKNSLNKPAPP